MGSSIVYTPSLEINFYSNSIKEHTISTVGSDNKEIKKISHKSDKGFNTVSFDLSYSKKGVKLHIKNNLDAAINGIYYLLKGKYKVQINDQTVTFDVE